jgi:hypothetical protein
VFDRLKIKVTSLVIGTSMRWSLPSAGSISESGMATLSMTQHIPGNHRQLISKRLASSRGRAGTCDGPNIGRKSRCWHLARLYHKPWFALAEFVDNSLHSSASNREALEGIEGSRRDARGHSHDEDERVLIHDTAAGIPEEHFPRAAVPAQRPPDTAGDCCVPSLFAMPPLLCDRGISCAR